ncbi:MAG: MaoC family dehydratase [Acidimicrobiia bacterium]|nr:MaoC family dehydratase [Acidimicrobiia bacterium]
MQIVPVDQLADYVGKDLGESDWFTVDQDRINAFANATNDHQFIHIDPEAAKATPWGTTIAHGFLTLSLLPFLTASAGIIPEGMVMAINYGLDKVRFLEPVRVGSEVRAKVRLADLAEKAPGRYLFKKEVTVEIKDSEKPALIAETLSMFIVP